jgi:hypothetical protein
MKYQLAIVSMFQNEGLILKEWIDHHLQIGVQHFYFINNGSSDTTEQILQPYKQYITCVYDPKPIFTEKIRKVPYWDRRRGDVSQLKTNVTLQQLLVNRHLLKEIKQDTQWVAFIDCDEYIYSPKGEQIQTILTQLPHTVKRIFIPWKIFGSNGHIEQPVSIRSGFTKRKNFVYHKNYYGFGKSIEKTSQIKCLRPHASLMYSDYTILPNGLPLTDDNMMHYDFTKTDLLACNHYIIMSKFYYETYKAKRTGGSTNIPRKNMDYWEKYDTQADDVTDNTLS